MPITDAAPPPAIGEQLPADYQLPSEILERVRNFHVLDNIGPKSACAAAGKAAAGADDNVIIVCAPQDPYLVGVWLPDPPSLMEDMGRALHTRVGPVEIGSDRGGLGLKVRF